MTTRLYFTPLEECEVCQSSEDDGTAVMQLRNETDIIFTLCWRCLGPHVEELYENPPEEDA